MEKTIRIDREKCIGCGLCVRDCAVKAIALWENKAQMMREHCMECGHCVAICPQMAVSMAGYDMGEVKEYDREQFEIEPEHFLNHIRFRRSVRQFTEKAVEREQAEQILEAGRYTPTGTNRQKNRYIVIERPEEGIEKEALQCFRKVKQAADMLGRFVSLPVDTRNYALKPGLFFQGGAYGHTGRFNRYSRRGPGFG